MYTSSLKETEKKERFHKTFYFVDIQSPDAEYVDLLLNPERYTGYKGPDAWRIWNVIYEENCFKYVPFPFRNFWKIQ